MRLKEMDTLPIPRFSATPWSLSQWLLSTEATLSMGPKVYAANTLNTVTYLLLFLSTVYLSNLAKIFGGK